MCAAVAISISERNTHTQNSYPFQDFIVFHIWTSHKFTTQMNLDEKMNRTRKKNPLQPNVVYMHMYSQGMEKTPRLWILAARLCCVLTQNMVFHFVSVELDSFFCSKPPFTESIFTVYRPTALTFVSCFPRNPSTTNRSTTDEFLFMVNIWWQTRFDLYSIDESHLNAISIINALIFNVSLFHIQWIKKKVYSYFHRGISRKMLKTLVLLYLKILSMRT